MRSFTLSLVLLFSLIAGPVLAQDTTPGASEGTTAVASQPAAAETASPTSQPVSGTKDIKAPLPPAGTGVVDPNDIGAIIKAAIDSAKTGKWALFVGLIMMLLTWLVNKILRGKIPSKVMPWLAIGLSTITAAAFALAVGAGWMNALVVGVQTGLGAAGTWSAMGRYIPGLAKSKPTVEQAKGQS